MSSRDDVFNAIAHPTRRRILTVLSSRGPASLNQLSDGFVESRQAVRKHIGILAAANLVRLERSGREQTCVLQAERLVQVEAWVSQFEQFWDTKLSSLQSFLDPPPSKNRKDDVVAKKKATTRKTPKVSAVKGKTVAWYIGTLEDWQAQIVSDLDQLICSTVPKATSSIKWAQPVYEFNGPFCFIKAAKKHVTFGFWRGVDLDDEKQLLEGTGDKMRHIKIREPADIRKTVFRKMVRQAVKLNQTDGDPSR